MLSKTNGIVFSISVSGQLPGLSRLVEMERIKNSFFVNDGANMLPFEGLGNISLLWTIDDLNLVDHLKAFKHRKV